MARAPTATSPPVDPAPRPDAAAAFARAEESFLAATHRYAKIVRDQHGLEASDRTVYYFDPGLDLVWIDRAWSSGGAEGRQQFQIEGREVRCFELRSNLAEKQVTAFCEGARSPALTDEEIAAAREAATDEIGLLVAALLEQQEAATMEEGCSAESVDARPPAGGRTHVTMVRLSVPNTLCARVADLLRELGVEPE